MTQTLPNMQANVAHHQASDRSLREFVDYFDGFMSLIEATDPQYTLAPQIRMSLELLRRHFSGKVTQPTYLVEVSGAPYATATRKLNEMIANGLVDRQAKTKSERSFTLHPSDKLLSAWKDLANDHSKLTSMMGKPSHSNAVNDHFFGSEYSVDRGTLSLNVLSKPLILSGGLKFLAHSDPSFLVMSNLKRHFEVVMGSPIHYRSFSLDKLYDETITNAARDRSAYDLISVNLPWVGELAATDSLMPLDDLLDLERLDPSDFHEASWNACHWNGKCYGIPVETTCELLMFRTDLFRRENVAPPATIDQLLAAAQKLHGSVAGISGIAWNAARGTPLGHTFMMAMADFGQPIIDLKRSGNGYSTSHLGSMTYKAMIDTQAGLAAAEFLCQLLEYSPPGILTMSWYERTRCFAEGRVAMAYGFSQMTPYFEQDETSPTYGKTDFVPHPTGCGAEPLSPVGGFILGIPRNLPAKRLENVVTALETFTSSRAQRLFVENGSRGCSRYSASDDPLVRAGSPVVEKIDELARKGSLQSWPRPPIPEIGSITQLCGVIMHDMLRGIISPKEAVERAQIGAQQIIENWQVS